MLHQLLEKIYRVVPYDRLCQEGCSDCCGAVPWGPAENKHITEWLKAHGRTALTVYVSTYQEIKSMKCPYLMDNRCSIYEVRPLICRLMGTVDHKILRCAKGRARTQLSGPLAQDLMNQLRVLEWTATADWNFIGVDYGPTPTWYTKKAGIIL